MVTYPIWYNKTGLEIVHGPMQLVSDEDLNRMNELSTKLPDGSTLIMEILNIAGLTTLAG